MCTSIGTFITVLSQSIANTALPTIVRSLHVSASESIWVVNGVQLAIVATLLFFGSVGDSRGAKRVYLSGMLAFTLATLGCALSQSYGMLITMRVISGIGAAAVIVTANALNRAVFPKEMLGRSVAVNSIFVAVATAAGPTVGGLILAFLPWPWIFALNVPLGLIGFFVGLRALPDIPASHAPIDYRSGLLAAVGFGTSVYALDGIARSMPPLQIGAWAALAVITMTLFIHRQLRLEAPMLAVNLFRVPIFSVSVLASSLTYAAQGLAYVSLPFFFQTVLGKTPLQSGLLLSAWAITALIVAIRMGPISDRHSASLLCTIGILIMGAGLLSFALLPAIPPDVGHRCMRRSMRLWLRGFSNAEQSRDYRNGPARTNQPRRRRDEYGTAKRSDARRCVGCDYLYGRRRQSRRPCHSRPRRHRDGTAHGMRFNHHCCDSQRRAHARNRTGTRLGNQPVCPSRRGGTVRHDDFSQRPHELHARHDHHQRGPRARRT